MSIPNVFRILVGVALLGLVDTGCAKKGAWVRKVLEAPEAHERWTALVDATDAGIETRFAMELMMANDPSSENRMSALLAWKATAPPISKAITLSQVVNYEPELSIALTALSCFFDLWAEKGLQELLKYYVFCVSSDALRDTCSGYRLTFADHPRESMAVLTSWRGWRGFPIPTSELAGPEEGLLDLSVALLKADKTLVEDARVRAWLTGYATQGRTRRIREYADTLLRGSEAAPD